MLTSASPKKKSSSQWAFNALRKEPIRRAPKKKKDKGKDALRCLLPSCDTRDDKQDPACDVKMMSIEGVAMEVPFAIHIGPFESESLRLEIEQSIDQCFEKVKSVFSPFLHDSEISRINAVSESNWILISEELFEVLHHSLLLHQLSGGLFDPSAPHFGKQFRSLVDDVITKSPPEDSPGSEAIKKVSGGSEWKSYREKYLPGMSLKERLQLKKSDEDGTACFYLQKIDPSLHIDLCGISKGWCVDRIFQELTGGAKFSSFAHVFVDWGGDIRCRGSDPRTGLPWLVAVASPFQVEKHLEPIVTSVTTTKNGGDLNKDSRLEITKETGCFAVCTSGTYLDKSNLSGLSHITNPHTMESIKSSPGGEQSPSNPEQLVSATVMCQTATFADALATAVLLVPQTDVKSWIQRFNNKILQNKYSSSMLVEKYVTVSEQGVTTVENPSETCDVTASKPYFPPVGGTHQVRLSKGQADRWLSVHSDVRGILTAIPRLCHIFLILGEIEFDGVKYSGYGCTLTSAVHLKSLALENGGLDAEPQRSAPGQAYFSLMNKCVFPKVLQTLKNQPKQERLRCFLFCLPDTNLGQQMVEDFSAGVFFEKGTGKSAERVCEQLKSLCCQTGYLEGCPLTARGKRLRPEECACLHEYCQLIMGLEVIGGLGDHVGFTLTGHYIIEDHEGLDEYAFLLRANRQFIPPRRMKMMKHSSVVAYGNASVPAAKNKPGQENQFWMAQNIPLSGLEFTSRDPPLLTALVPHDSILCFSVFDSGARSGNLPYLHLIADDDVDDDNCDPMLTRQVVTEHEIVNLVSSASPVAGQGLDTEQTTHGKCIIPARLLTGDKINFIGAALLSMTPVSHCEGAFSHSLVTMVPLTARKGN